MTEKNSGVAKWIGALVVIATFIISAVFVSGQFKGSAVSEIRINTENINREIDINRIQAVQIGRLDTGLGDIKERIAEQTAYTKEQFNKIDTKLETLLEKP